MNVPGVRFLPPEVADDLRELLPAGVRAALGHGEGLYRLERLVEQVYAQGYAAGHRRGRDDGWRDGRASVPQSAQHELLGVLRAAVEAAELGVPVDRIEVTPEQLANPGHVQVLSLVGGNTEYRPVDLRSAGDVS